MEETQSFKGIMTVKEIKYPKADKLLNELLKDSRVDAGYFEGMVGSEGFALPDIAFINEIGSGYESGMTDFTGFIPSRPFMTRAIEMAEKEIVAFAYAEMKKDNYTAERFYKSLGGFLVKQIKMQIKTSKSWATPNADATVKAKGSSQPLFDDGHMMRSADFKAIHNSMFKRFTL
jgi:hypothetical protein